MPLPARDTQLQLVVGKRAEGVELFMGTDAALGTLNQNRTVELIILD
jgi:hypothetical protein